MGHINPMYKLHRQNVAYTYNKTLLSLKKERNSNTCYNMNEPQKQYTKWSQPDTKR